jgi:hypothetical protein
MEGDWARCSGPAVLQGALDADEVAVVEEGDAVGVAALVEQAQVGVDSAWA